MAVTARTVTEEVVFLWDGVTQRLAKGQVLAVEAGGALERAIGLHRLIPHGLPAAQPAAAPAETLTVEAAGPQGKPAPKPAAAKKQDSGAGKDGEVTRGG
jgi:hypothetical protein